MQKETDKKTSRFCEGERILCVHGPLIHDAKCLKIRKNKDGTDEYLVHYAGWNKSWDEWITDVRILKYNEQNLTRQRELSNFYKNAKKIRCKAALSTVYEDAEIAVGSDGNLFSYRYVDTSVTDYASPPSTPNPDKSSSNYASENEAGSSSSKKKSRLELEHGVETEEQFLDKVEVKVKIPDELKPWLVDDWDLVCRQKKLFLLPAKNTVDNIIENYIKQKTNVKNSAVPKESAAVQTANSLREYFNATLGSQLLFKNERVQYNQIIDKYPDKHMSSIYGAAHLLRLFVILGGLIANTEVNDKTVLVLKCQLQDFLKYLLKNSSTLFSTQNYENSTTENKQISIE